jgi:hypothetical protein
MGDMSICKHHRMVSGYWEDNWQENWATGEEYNDSIWHPDHFEDTFVDLDLHRMKCTQCGAIKYYSGAAHDYYEKGIPSSYIKIDKQ